MYKNLCFPIDCQADATIDRIKSFILTQKQNLVEENNKDVNIEVEGKLGYFENHDSKSDVIEQLLQLSYQGPILLNKLP